MDSSLSAQELSRYSRHLLLDQVGPEGQLRLKKASVLIVGAGGLGSPLALYLAAAGVGTLAMVDFDRVDESNLQRQILHGTKDVGRSKLDSAIDRIADCNPLVKVIAHPVTLDSGNALEIIRGYDLVVDGTDNFATRYLINDACVLLGKPNVYGSIFRFEGQVCVFSPKDGGPCYRCLYPEPPPPGTVPSCAEGGVLGVLPGVIGTLQATEILKWILGAGESLLGRLLLFNALKMSFQELKVPRDPNCAVCGVSPTIVELLDYPAFCGALTVPEISAEELLQRSKANPRLTLIDVREPYEWERQNLEALGARLIPLKDLNQQAAEWDRKAEIVIYCQSGGRSAKAVSELLRTGFANVCSLKGGISDWPSAGEDPS